VITCLTKYFTFKGTASRSEFWWFFLFFNILIVLGVTLDGTWNKTDLFDSGFWESLFTLVLIIPFIAVACRRLHDIGKSGWWQLIGITIIGYIPLIYWWCMPTIINIKNTPNAVTDSTTKNRLKKMNRWVKYIILPISSIVLVLAFIGLLTMTSILPNTDVQMGSELSQRNKIELINNGIINKNDKILFFYSEGIFSILEDGQLITNDKIVTYEENEEGLIEIYKMKLKNIKEVVLEEKGSFFSSSIYRIIGNEDAESEYIIIYLSIENNKDKDFINAIYRKIK